MHYLQDIADVVCRRAELGRNFGTVLIPDALLMHLPNMKILLAELRRIIREAQSKGEMKKAQVTSERSYSHAELQTQVSSLIPYQFEARVSVKGTGRSGKIREEFKRLDV